MSMPSTATAIVATNAIFLGFAVLSVGLRFLARRRTSSAIKQDDWLVVVALIWAAAMAITNIVGVPVGGLGYDFESLSQEKSETFLYVVFIAQFFYIFAVAFVKLSVLYLYRRIFSGTRTPVAITVLIVLTCLWLVSFFFATLLQDIPIYCNWVNCESSSNYPIMYIMSSVTDIALDLSILALPAFFIRRLKISKGKKVAIGGIFALGLFCVVASVARLVYSVTFREAFLGEAYAANFDLSLDDWMLWSGIEACMSTVCANLPCYNPLFSWWKQSLGSMLGYGSSGRGSGSGSARSPTNKLFFASRHTTKRPSRTSGIGMSDITASTTDDFDDKALRADDQVPDVPTHNLRIHKTTNIETSSTPRSTDDIDRHGRNGYYEPV